MPEIDKNGQSDTRPGEETCAANAGAAPAAARSRLMQRELEIMRQLQDPPGSETSGSGCRGRAIQMVKRVVQRILARQTRAQQQFNLMAVRLAARQARAIEDLSTRLDSLERNAGEAQRGAARSGAARGAADDCDAEANGNSALPFGLNLLGFVTSEKGVGEAIRCNLRVCRAGHIPHVANSFVDPGSVNVEALPESFSAENPYRFNLISVNPPELPIVVERLPGYGKGRYNVGYWNWELSSLPREWLGCFAYLDEVWVPSRFVQGAVEPMAPVPVRCVPLAIDPDMSPLPEWNRQRLGIAQDVFVFLFFFDFQSSAERKNPAGLIRAYRQAFGDRRDVLLLIKSSHARGHERELAALKQLAGGANVRVLDEVLPRGAIYSLMTLSDVYVSLHRSEGFGLTLSEAMLCGKPVIATGYSGNMDFMTADNSCPVRFRMAEINRDHGPYRKGNCWAEPDLDHAAELMGQLERDRRLAAAVGARGKAAVLARLHPAVIAASVQQRLTELASGREAAEGR
jgi:glycosyltransferase involved in cell wall biosynthesis